VQKVRISQPRAYPDIATREFAIGEKVSRSDLKTIFILGFEVKKGDRLTLHPEVCDLQGEVRRRN